MNGPDDQFEELENAVRRALEEQAGRVQPGDRLDAILAATSGHGRSARPGALRSSKWLAPLAAAASVAIIAGGAWGLTQDRNQTPPPAIGTTSPLPNLPTSSPDQSTRTTRTAAPTPSSGATSAPATTSPTTTTVPSPSTSSTRRVPPAPSPPSSTPRPTTNPPAPQTTPPPSTPSSTSPGSSSSTSSPTVMISISTPADGATLSAGAVIATGRSCVFEAASSWQLRQGSALVGSGSTTATSGCPTTGSWRVNLGSLSPGSYTLRMYAVSPADGSTVIAEDSVSFTVR